MFRKGLKMVQSRQSLLSKQSSRASSTFSASAISSVSSYTPPSMVLQTFPLLDRIVQHAKSTPDAAAIIDTGTVTYAQLVVDIASFALTLIRLKQATELNETRVIILCEKGYLVPLALLATWSAGGLAVPLLTNLPIPEQWYVVENSQAGIIVCDETNRARAMELAGYVDGCEVFVVDLDEIRSKPSRALDGSLELSGERRAMMLYTSGTVRATVTPLMIDRPAKRCRHETQRPHVAGFRHCRYVALVEHRECIRCAG